MRLQHAPPLLSWSKTIKAAMTTRTTITGELSETASSTIRPFEWLTSPVSLSSLIQEHVLGNRYPPRDGTSCSDDAEACPPPLLKALHVGCGSSTVGEYLVHKMNFSKVVNLDCDHETMQRMQARWIDISRWHSPSRESSQMEFLTLDFTKEQIPDEYTHSFDLVLDKSTLDCTLCSDTATASLLVECYRTMRPDGGVYLVISFHELDLLLPLLRDLPGAQWKVECTTMDRQVEEIRGGSDSVGATAESTTMPSATASHNQKPLNVLIARRFTSPDGDPNDGTSSELDFDEVYNHVHRVNDQWFQEQQPLLTERRIDELKRAFGTADKDYALGEAFPLLFTEAEREHLTFDHFLEDWEAFVNEKGNTSKTTMNFETATEFLKEMQ
jgi:Methyltransferase domain